MDRINSTWRTPLVCSLLAVATLATFWPVSHNAFLNYDDPGYVTRNPYLTGGLTQANVTWAFQTGYACNWHPVTWLSHMLDVQLFGLNAGRHHLTSLLLHVANALLLFLVLKRMTGALWRSAFVAALFALHPLHVESVAWASERKDVLSAFFFTLTLWAYARYVEVQSPRSKVQSRESEVQSPESKVRSPTSRIPQHTSRFCLPSSIFYVLSLSFFALGLMSKPMLVTLPFVLLLLDFWPLRRFQLSTINSPLSTKTPLHHSVTPPLRLVLEKLPFLALSAISCGVTFLVQRQAVATFEALPFGHRMAHALAAYFDYLQQTFWPSQLLVFYPFPAELSAARIIGSATLLAAVSAAALFLVRRRPWLPVGWFWYLGMLVPVIGLVQVGERARADRYTYLPLIGIFILVAWTMEALLAAAGPREETDSKFEVRSPKFGVRGGLLSVGAGVVLAGLAMVTHRQVGFWRDNRSLFGHVVQVATNNYVGWKGLGLVDLQEGNDPEAALAKFMRASACNRAYGSDYQNMYFIGTALQILGKGLEALPYLERCVVSPEDQPYRDYRLGLSLTEAGRLAEAEAALRRAIEARPQEAEFQLGMVALLQARGQAAKAEEFLRELVQRNLGSAQVHRALAEFLMLNNRPAGAENQHTAALNQQGKTAEAVHELEASLKLEPKQAQANLELAELLSQQSRSREAAARYSQALDVNPKLLSALNNLAWLLATDPDASIRNGSRAVELAERACQLTEWKVAFLMGTLAAAYAEAGRFAEAVATAERARDQARADKLEDVAKKNGELLELYRAGKTLREGK